MISTMSPTGAPEELAVLLVWFAFAFFSHSNGSGRALSCSFAFGTSFAPNKRLNQLIPLLLSSSANAAG
jgi:hypothetical protein